MPTFDILSIVGDPWNETNTTFGGIKLNVTETAASSYDSRFLEFLLNGRNRFTVWKSGETYIQNEDGSILGGFGMRGSTMALTSKIDPNSGRPADVFRWYWDSAAIGSADGSVAVLHGMGKNRLSIESLGAIVHIAQNGRYEFETKLSGEALQFVGYSFASSDGVPFLFTSHGHTTFPNSVVQIGGVHPSHYVLQTGTYDGLNFTANTQIDASGGLFTRQLTLVGTSGSKRGVTARSSNETSARAFFGMDRFSAGFLGFGSGSGPLDATIYRAGPNMFAFGGEPTAGVPAIKSLGTALQGRLADDSDYCPVQGKLTTDQAAVNETITPDSTLILYDASGTAYKVPCVAVAA